MRRLLAGVSPVVALLGAGALSLPAAQAGDTTPPTVTKRVPAPGAVGVPVGRSVRVTASEPLDAATVDQLTVYLQESSKRVHASVSLSEDGTLIVLDPNRPLRPGAMHTVSVVGGEHGIADLAGNVLEERVSWTFTTNAPPRIAVISPEPDSTTTDRTPAIEFKVRDVEGRVPKRRISVRVDGEQRAFDYERRTGTLAPRLRRGEHTVRVAATDSVGVTTTRKWSFTIERR